MQCKFCTDLVYLSYIKCLRCSIVYCIHHQFMCGCAAPHVQLKYRFSNNELLDLMNKIEYAVEEANEAKPMAYKSY